MMKRIFPFAQNRGFSLVEMLIVCGILGILSLVINDFYTKFQRQGYYAEARISMIHTVDAFERIIKRDMAQMNRTNSNVMLYDFFGAVCAAKTNCTKLQFDTSRPNPVASQPALIVTVTYTTLCINDLAGNNNHIDISKQPAVGSCLTCPRNQHPIICYHNGSTGQLCDNTYDLTSINGAYNPYSAGGMLCISQQPDNSLILRITAGLISASNHTTVTPYNKEILVPTSSAESVQILQ